MFLLQQPCQGSPRLQKLNGLATKVKTIFVSRSEAETSQVSHELSVAEPSPIELKPSPIELAFEETVETSLQLGNSLHRRVDYAREARRRRQPY